MNRFSCMARTWIGGYRIHQAGWRVSYNPHCTVLHYKRGLQPSQSPGSGRVLPGDAGFYYKPLCSDDTLLAATGWSSAAYACRGGAVLLETAQTGLDILTLRRGGQDEAER